MLYFDSFYNRGYKGTGMTTQLAQTVGARPFFKVFPITWSF